MRSNPYDLFAKDCLELLLEDAGRVERSLEVAAPAQLIDAVVELPVCLNGKVKERIELPKDADQATVEKVVAASSNLEFDGPEGKIKFHASNHHLWKHARIGAFRPDGQVDMIYESPLIEPNPFPKL